MKINLLALLILSTTCVSAQTQFAVAANDNATRLEKKPDFFRPITRNVSNHTTYRRYATNANRPGVIQLGLGWGSVFGGAQLTVRDSFDTYHEQGLGLTHNIGFRFQCGISETVSLGFYIRKDIGSYVTEFEDFSISGLGLGFEGKVYPINKEMFAVYVAPTVGYSFANSRIDKEPGKGVGLNYGLTAGINWYWTEAFGMSCDVGYTGSTLVGIFDDPDLSVMDYDITYGGLYFGVGLVLKFDTRQY